MSANGRLTYGELSPIGGGFYLAKAAAPSFVAMSQDCQRRWGRPLSVISAYRTLSMQWVLWQRYRAGIGNLAAYPGTSNHGWGLAVDLTPTWSRWAVDQIGRTYGWSKACSDAPGEWWHVRFNPGCTGATWHGSGSGPRILHQGMSGSDVAKVQKHLVHGGYLHKQDRTHPKAIDGHFGASTKAAVQHFQRDRHMPADGVVGPRTLDPLLKL